MVKATRALAALTFFGIGWVLAFFTPEGFRAGFGSFVLFSIGFLCGIAALEAPGRKRQ